MKHTTLSEIFYVKVPNDLLGPNMPPGHTEGILHGVFGREGQLLLTHILLQSGAHWSGIPLIALTIGGSGGEHLQDQLQPWGCMGGTPNVSKLEYLEGLIVRPRFIDEPGRHTGIIIDWAEKFSKHPQEHKPLSLIHLQSGSLALLPNNYFFIEDPHFTQTSELTKHYRRGEEQYWETPL
jgi:hypothetical protein